MDKIWLHFDGKNGFEYNFKLQVKSKIYNIIIKYCPVCILGGYLLPFSDRSNQTSLNAPNSKRYKHYRTLRMSLFFKSLSRYVKTNLINFIKENLFVWLVPVIVTKHWHHFYNRFFNNDDRSLHFGKKTRFWKSLMFSGSNL